MIRKWIIKTPPAYIALGVLITPWALFTLYIGWKIIIGAISLVAFFGFFIVSWDEWQKKLQLAQNIPRPVVFPKVEQLEMEADIAMEEVRRITEGRYINGKTVNKDGTQISTIDRAKTNEKLATVKAEEKERNKRLKQRIEKQKEIKVELEITPK